MCVPFPPEEFGRCISEGLDCKEKYQLKSMSVNSLWPRDVIRRHILGQHWFRYFVQVMALCLNHCWLIISAIFWHSPVGNFHDDVIKWKHFPRYWRFVCGIHRSPVNSRHKGQWRGTLMFSLICAWINGWVNNREAGDLRRHRAYYDVTVLIGNNQDFCPWCDFENYSFKIAAVSLRGQWAFCQIRKIAGVHAPGMPGTFSSSLQVSDLDMHHGTCVTHVPWCMPGSLTSGFLWNRRRGKTFPAFPAHAQPAILRIW